jgi:hypothetical protein
MLTTKLRRDLTLGCASQELADTADFLGRLLDEQEYHAPLEKYVATPNDPIPVLWEAAGL